MKCTVILSSEELLELLNAALTERLRLPKDMRISRATYITTHGDSEIIFQPVEVRDGEFQKASTETTGEIKPTPSPLNMPAELKDELSL